MKLELRVNADLLAVLSARMALAMLLPFRRLARMRSMSALNYSTLIALHIRSNCLLTV